MSEKSKCWDCVYCDKESVLVNGNWKLTRIGYCLAENSSVNGKYNFYVKVYIDTETVCNEFEKKV